MKQKAWKPYAVFIGLALAVGGLGAIVTKSGMPRYDMALKPSFTPPDWLFPVVWTLLYILMGVGMARVWRRSGSTRALTLYLVQLGVNLLWSVWFFGEGSYGFAFFWLLGLTALVIAMTLSFRRADAWAARLQIPYILWCVFAAALNRAVWMLNR